MRSCSRYVRVGVPPGVLTSYQMIENKNPLRLLRRPGASRTGKVGSAAGTGGMDRGCRAEGQARSERRGPRRF